MNRVLMASSQTRRPLGHKVIYCLFWHNRSNPAEWYRVVPNKRFSTENRRRRDRNKTTSLIYVFAWNVFKIVNSNSNCFKSFFFTLLHQNLQSETLTYTKFRLCSPTSIFGRVLRWYSSFPRNTTTSSNVILFGSANRSSTSWS